MCCALLGVFTNWKKPASLDQPTLIHWGPCLLNWSNWLLEHATPLLLAFQWKPVLWSRIKHLARFQVFRVNFNVHKWRLRCKFVFRAALKESLWCSAQFWVWSPRVVDGITWALFIVAKWNFQNFWAVRLSDFIWAIDLAGFEGNSADQYIWHFGICLLERAS